MYCMHCGDSGEGHSQSCRLYSPKQEFKLGLTDAQVGMIGRSREGILVELNALLKMAANNGIGELNPYAQGKLIAHVIEGVIATEDPFSMTG